MKSMKALLNNPDGSLGGGSLTISSNSSNTAKGLGVCVQRLVGGRGGGVDSLTGVGFSPTCCTHSEPNIEAKSLSSGGGIGYIPIAISTSDNPSDQMSLCTE